MIKNNLKFELPNQLKFTLHISIINYDGNIYDCIAYAIQNLFSDIYKKKDQLDLCLARYISLEHQFTCNTFCVIENKLILDPTTEEVSISSFYFSVLKKICTAKSNNIEDEEYFVHKIKGESINFKLLEKAFNLC